MSGLRASGADVSALFERAHEDWLRHFLKPLQGARSAVGPDGPTVGATISVRPPASKVSARTHVPAYKIRFAF